MTNKIPAFKTIQEEAEFWDTHDTIDLEGEFKLAKVMYKPKMEQFISVRLPTDDLQKLRAIATQKRIGVTALIRILSLEFLNSRNPPSVL